LRRRLAGKTTASSAAHDAADTRAPARSEEPAARTRREPRPEPPRDTVAREQAHALEQQAIDEELAAIKARLEK
jgi:hypothetical protein